MKKVWHAVQARVLYLIFGFFVMIFVTVLSKNANPFRFRDGKPGTPEQRDIALFVLLLLVIVSGYGAFKRAQLDCKLWKRKRPHNKSDSERQPK
jgi:hypothetical protein